MTCRNTMMRSQRVEAVLFLLEMGNKKALPWAAGPMEYCRFSGRLDDVFRKLSKILRFFVERLFFKDDLIRSFLALQGGPNSR